MGVWEFEDLTPSTYPMLGDGQGVVGEYVCCSPGASIRELWDDGLVLQVAT